MDRSSSEGKSVMSNKEEEEKECQITKEEKGQRKRKKRKDKGRGSDCDRSIHSADWNHSFEMEQAEVSAKMAANPCSEHAEGVMSKNTVKKHSKKRKKDKEVETIGQKHILDADENVGSEDAERNKEERERERKKHRKKRKIDREVETIVQKQILDANENVESEDAERNMEEHDRKLKKGKRKHQDRKTASNGSSGEKEYLVTLECDNKSDMSNIGNKTESKKKRRKESDNVGVDLRQSTPAGEVKNGNGNKEEKTCEDENDGGEREKENVAKRKDKGRRVSFADDVEVFNIDVGDDASDDGSGETELVHGRRFTSEENAKLMEAMVKYVEMKQLGEKGLEMIGDSRKHPEISGCWAEIDYRRSMVDLTESKILK